jgi:uncharacterized membrane protein YbhN (UPF0104 family)
MVTIPLKIKYFLIIIIIFSIIYWFQMVDDKKRCKEKTNNYDKIKLPLLVSTIVGLVLLWNNNSLYTISSMENGNMERSIEITTNYSNLDIYTGLPEW